MFIRAIIANSHLCLRVRPNATQITVNYSATSDTEVKVGRRLHHMADEFGVSYCHVECLDLTSLSRMCLFFWLQNF